MNSPPQAARPRSAGAPSTSTASGRRCGASRRASSRSTISARCAFWSTKSRTATPRLASCTTFGRRCRASSTTTSPSPRPTTTARCTPPSSGRRASRSRCRSAPSTCTGSRSTAWRRTGATRKARTWGAVIPATRTRSPGCGRCSTGRMRWPMPASGCSSSSRAYSPRRSTCSRRRAAWSTCRAAPRRSTLPTRCIRASATAVAVRASMARWCRSTSCLSNGQRVEIVAAKQGGPSRDWLNPELGYVHSHRARAKVRQWFKSQQVGETIAHGRDTVERELARAGMTALNLDALAGAGGVHPHRGLLCRRCAWRVSICARCRMRSAPSASPTRHRLRTRRHG